MPVLIVGNYYFIWESWLSPACQGIPVPYYFTRQTTVTILHVVMQVTIMMTSLDLNTQEVCSVHAISSAMLLRPCNV